jgi:hypothetical protein
MTILIHAGVREDFFNDADHFSEISNSAVKKLMTSLLAHRTSIQTTIFPERYEIRCAYFDRNDSAVSVPSHGSSAPR